PAFPPASTPPTSPVPPEEGPRPARRRSRPPAPEGRAASRPGRHDHHRAPRGAANPHHPDADRLLRGGGRRVVPLQPHPGLPHPAAPPPPPGREGHQGQRGAHRHLADRAAVPPPQGG